jgi:hypothetical protein
MRLDAERSSSCRISASIVLIAKSYNYEKRAAFGVESPTGRQP